MLLNLERNEVFSKVLIPKHKLKVLFTNAAPLIKFGLAEGFSQLSHQVKIMLSEEERLWGQSINDQKKRLRRAIEKFKPDFIFTEGHPGFDAKSICETALHFKIPHLYWAIEDPVCTDLTIKSYIPYVDYVFTTTIEKLPIYKALGKKAELLLFGCNPEFHRYTGPTEKYSYDLVLVASNYSSRYEEIKWFLLPLVEKGYHMKVWGIWWDDPDRPVNLLNYPDSYGGVLPYEELPSVYSSSKIILGVNCDDTSITQTSMRPYEALACGGGLYLGHYTQAQENIFKDYIFQAHDMEETVAKVNMILDLKEEERHLLAQKAQKMVYEEHSYHNRARQIIKAWQRL
jgi:spore maturation protein CgeB